MKCNNCLIEKGSSDFWLIPTGLLPYCKTCSGSYNRDSLTKRKNANNKYARTLTHNMRDCYIKSLLSQQFKIKTNDIPDDLISDYKNYLLTKRHLKRLNRLNQLNHENSK